MNVAKMRAAADAEIRLTRQVRDSRKMLAYRATCPASRPVVVLIVEDDGPMSRLIADLVTMECGEPRIAYSVDGAFKALVQTPRPRAAVLDWGLPDGTPETKLPGGRTLLATLRALNIPTVIYTARRLQSSPDYFVIEKTEGGRLLRAWLNVTIGAVTEEQAEEEQRR